MSQNLHFYEMVARASTEMLEAARHADWDALVAAEKRCAGTIAQLRAAGGEAALEAKERQRKAEIIRAILAQDAEIRRLVDPRMAEIENWLTVRGHQRQLEKSYRT